jgi:predicted neuraminidase
MSRSLLVPFARGAARGLAALLLLLGSTASALASGEFRVERVFGPEVATGPYKHPACMAELDGGDLYLVYYGGKGEYARDTAVYGSRLKKGEDRWSPPRPIARDPLRSVGNAVVWQAPDGLVWLFYVVRDGETWSTSRIQFKVSDDGARSWSDASVLTSEQGLMVRNRPIVLADGQYLLPAYKETGHDTERVGPDSVSAFLRFDPKKKAWTDAGRIPSAKGNIQPAVAMLDNGLLLAYCRRGGGYGPEEVGYLVRSESRDGGLTWSPGRDSRFPNPNAAVDLLRLKSGRLLLVYNDCTVGRTPLTASISPDNDRTWPHKRNVAEGPGDFGYPLAFQARDGRIHLVFTSHERTVINHAVFDEDWVLIGK